MAERVERPGPDPGGLAVAAEPLGPFDVSSDPDPDPWSSEDDPDPDPWSSEGDVAPTT